MFKRKIMDEILKWEDSLKIKKRALVVKGLRQVGKTTIVKQYCEKNTIMSFISTLWIIHH